MRLKVMIVATAALAGLSHAAAARDLDACTAPIGEIPTLPGIQVSDVAAASGDMAALKVTSAATGAHMMVYYDAGSQAAARSRAACLGAQLPMLEGLLGDGRRDAEWSAAVFTQDSTYIPPRGPGVVVRWQILVAPDGALTETSQRMITSTLPHEQVHVYQHHAGARLPRWFTEGHATWIGSRITPLLDVDAARNDVARKAVDLAAASGPLNLAGWGTVRPRREAILRQVSPEDRARMQADPTYSPGGSFSFTSADFIGDESNMPARYAAALRVFEGLEARHGTAAVSAWAAQLIATPGLLTNQAMADTVTTHFGESLDDILGD